VSPKACAINSIHRSCDERHFTARGLGRRTHNTITHHARTHTQRQTTSSQSAKSARFLAQARCHRHRPLVSPNLPKVSLELNKINTKQRNVMTWRNVTDGRYNAPFTRNLMWKWNMLMTLKYRQGHRHSYHLKANVWFLISNFSLCGRHLYNFRDIGRERVKWASNIIQGHQKWHQSKASVWFLLADRSRACDSM